MTREEAFRIIELNERSGFSCSDRATAVRMAWGVLAETAKAEPTPLGNLGRFGPDPVPFPADLAVACGAICEVQHINKAQVSPEIWPVIRDLHAHACRMANEIAAHRGLDPVFDDQGKVINMGTAR